MKQMKGLDLVENRKGRHQSSHVDNIGYVKSYQEGNLVLMVAYDMLGIHVDILYSRIFAMGKMFLAVFDFANIPFFPPFPWITSCFHSFLFHRLYSLSLTRVDCHGI